MVELPCNQAVVNPSLQQVTPLQCGENMEKKTENYNPEIKYNAICRIIFPIHSPFVHGRNSVDRYKSTEGCEALLTQTGFT